MIENIALGSVKVSIDHNPIDMKKSCLTVSSFKAWL